MDDVVDGGVAEVANLTPLATKVMGRACTHTSPAVITNVEILERGTDTGPLLIKNYHYYLTKKSSIFYESKQVFTQI